MSKYENIMAKKCPVCKEMFIPAGQHVWKIKGDRLVCSYKCMRKFEKEYGERKRYVTVK